MIYEIMTGESFDFSLSDSATSMDLAMESFLKK
jgi:hypothetical protein